MDVWKYILKFKNETLNTYDIISDYTGNKKGRCKKCYNYVRFDHFEKHFQNSICKKNAYHLKTLSKQEENEYLFSNVLKQKIKKLKQKKNDEKRKQKCFVCKKFVRIDRHSKKCWMMLKNNFKKT